MSTQQHTGRLSDSIDNETDLSAALRAKVKIRPTGKVFHGVSTIGNGDHCPMEGHGKMIVLSNGRQWCPNQSHDKERVVKSW
jgi:hypothetical protein